MKISLIWHKNMIHINGETKIVGLLGWTVKHSLNPIMQNAAFQHLKLNWAYIPLPTAPESIKNGVRSLQTFNFIGANVIAPHQQAIMRYLDEISPLAQSIGVVNTIVIRDGIVYGYNTERYGFLQTLADSQFNLEGSRCLVLGAGGAARSVVFSLASSGAKTISVYNRTIEHAAFLVDDLQSTFSHVQFSFNPLTAKRLIDIKDTVDLIVNTTPLGMSPDVDSSPWPEDISLGKAMVCDLVYNPLQTRFLRQAQAEGLKTIDGVGMVVHQGAKAYEIWTGQSPPTDLMRMAVLAKL